MKNGYGFISVSEKLQSEVFLFLLSSISLTLTFKAIYNSVSCIVLFLFWIVFMEKKFEWTNMKLILVISLLFWFSLVGLTTTQNRDEGLWQIQQKALLLLMPLVFGTIKIDRQKILNYASTFMVLGVVISSLFCLIFAAIQFVRHQESSVFFAHGLTSSIDIYPYILSLFSLASIVVLAQAFFGKSIVIFGVNNRVKIVLIIFLSLIIFLLSVKQIVFLWIIFTMTYIFKTYESKKLLLAILLLGFGLTLAFFFIPTLREKVNEMVNGEQNTIPLDQDASLGRTWNGIAMRKAVWTCALDVVKNNFWWGVGTGDAQDELQAAYENRQFYFASRYNRFNAHNQYLQVLINFGLVGFTIWASSLVLFFVFNKNDLLPIYFTTIILFAMFTESMLEVNKGILAVSFLMTVFSFQLSAHKKSGKIQ